MTDSTPAIARPWWLLLLFGVQGLGWLLQTLFAILFSLYSTGTPDGPHVTLYLLFQTGVTLAAAAIFVVGMVRPIHDSVGARFIAVHAAVALLIAVPLTVLGLWAAVGGFDQRGWSEVARIVGSLFVYAFVPAAALYVRGSEKTWLVVLAGLVVVVWVGVGAFFLLGAGVGVAGITA